ncbi:unnamed protein product [Caenorhabditis bovis]|uniref:Abnormal cell migration protein 18-like fibronectin type I domain-containing protein n=1 Tax=Caenorhabditis bovis TaxID=2654633 RepID=A0A8S1EW74_9PELO|nr:unnamed protein product [Caenorhabditis bovis]
MWRRHQTLLLLFLLCSLIADCFSQCDDNGQIYAPGDKWIRNNHFLVTCREGKIQTLKCVTDNGHLLDVGHKSFVEHGYEYSCTNETPSQDINVNSCSTFADFSDDIFKDRFAICCISRRFKGCVDVNGDIVKTGYFIIGNRSLKYCRIQADQLNARIEPKGCFNGTTNDDIHDETLHIKKYTVWREGEFEYRCGDDGIHIQRCFPADSKKPVWAGSAWIQKDGAVKTCGKIH